MLDDTKKYVYLSLALIFLGLTPFVSKQINIPLTGSVAPYVLWKTGEHNVRQNDYVLFMFSHKLLPRPMMLTKRIGCMPGQHLVRRNQHFFCDDELIAIVFEFDSTGKKLPVFQYDGIIPAGKAFVVGDNEQSFDSRYWGFIPLDRVERLRPLF
ncbi:S26 family signal peptidase [Dickeya sp. NCPPB 3274]|uniref:S26 family signal peptidase n=1 Tax=Dickeya sp. NCPPB 3274 TaxID=568766 RepID=UPI0006ACA549|nr:S26 family signal peptidase [Dickeya sp. NCPPB 3274]